MKGLFLVLFWFVSVVSQAVPERSVYPNSGPTDAKIDENTNIDAFSSSSSTSPNQNSQDQQEENSMTKKKDEFEPGPYDKDGTYRYIPKIRQL